MKTALLLLALMAMAAACRQRAPSVVADLLIVNARIWTGVADRPESQALAVVDGRVAAIGTAEELSAWRGPSTAVIDAGGARVLPGFNDSHMHFMGGGMQLENADLRQAPSPQAFARLIGERVQKTPPGEWVLGGDWDDQLWDPPALPTRQLIDPVSPVTPVFVNRFDGHIGGGELRRPEAGREDPLYEATHGKPKAMLDICGKPMIQWVLDALNGSQLVDKVIVSGLG